MLRLASVYGVRPSAAALKSAGYAALGQVVGKGSARVLTAFVPGLGSIARSVHQESGQPCLRLRYGD